MPTATSLTSLFLRRSGLTVPCAALLLAGCSAGDVDAADGAGGDLSAARTTALCSEPVISDDGAWVALNVCPKGATAGRIVRVSVATNAKKEIATYAATDRVDKLSGFGSNLAYAVYHDVQGGNATSGIDVVVHDWALTTSRTITAAPPSGVSGAFSYLSTLTMTKSGSHVAFAAGGAPDVALTHYLFVAETTGSGPVVPVDVSDASSYVFWWPAQTSFLGVTAKSEGKMTLRVVDTGGPGVAQVSPTLTLGPGDPSVFVDFSTMPRPESSYDGSTLLGGRGGWEGITALTTVDPKTGTETVIANGERIMGARTFGTDVIYETDSAPNGTFTTSLVRQARLPGATPATLMSATAATKEELPILDLVAGSATSAFGIASKDVGTPSSPSLEYYVVKLDGSAPAAPVGAKWHMVDASERAAVFSQVTPSGSPMIVYQRVDLTTGAITPVNAGGSILGGLHVAGNGSLVSLDPCEVGGKGGTEVTRIDGNVTKKLACSPALGGPGIFRRVPGSGTVVTWNDEPESHYSVTIVRP